MRLNGEHGSLRRYHSRSNLQSTVSIAKGVDWAGSQQAGEGLSEKAIREGYSRFKAEKNAAELAGVAGKHGLNTLVLEAFVDTILQRMIFDGEALTELMEPLGLNWKTRRVKELDLMEDLIPLLLKRAGGREISGLSAYEQ